jgi:hypothetical protein
MTLPRAGRVGQGTETPLAKTPLAKTPLAKTPLAKTAGPDQTGPALGRHWAGGV